MFTNFDLDKYEELLIDTAYEQPETLMNIRKGHALDMHTDFSDMDLLSRAIKEEKSYVSCFTELNDYTVVQRIADAIINKAPEISEWACAKRNEFSNPLEYNRMVLNVDLNYDEPVGKGFDNSFREINTDFINVVLQRDKSGENSFGFYVLTAYPDLEKGYKTGQEYTYEQIIKGKSDLTLNEKLKGYLKRNGHSECQIVTDKYTGVSQLGLFFKEDSRKISIYERNKTKELTKAELASVSKEAYNVYDKIEMMKALLSVEKDTAEKQNTPAIKPVHKKQIGIGD